MMINTASISEYVLLDPVRKFLLEDFSLMTKDRHSTVSVQPIPYVVQKLTAGSLRWTGFLALVT